MSIGFDFGCWFKFGLDYGTVSVLRCGLVQIWVSRKSLFLAYTEHQREVANILKALRQDKKTACRPSRATETV